MHELTTSATPSADAGAHPTIERKSLIPVLVEPPPAEQRVARDAQFAAEGEKRNRYHLPASLDSTSPVGYRRRIPLSPSEAEEALALLSMARPTGFGPAEPLTEKALFEECALGVMSARQSTNYRGQEQRSFGPEDSARIAELLKRLPQLAAQGPVLDGASHTHVILSRPYRTPFTMLLTLVGHKPLLSLLQVPKRLFHKRVQHQDDIPTIGYLRHLHIGVLAEALERAAVIASAGQRRAAVYLLDPTTKPGRGDEARALAELEKLCGLDAKAKRAGWRVNVVSQVGAALEGEAVSLTPALARKLGANALAFRSERVQPGVNNEEKAPEPYQARQDMDLPETFTLMAGRAAYNAFAHWTGCDREAAKSLLLLDRIDVLTPGGKERLRAVRKSLNDITDEVIKNLPLWADLPTGKAFSRNCERGRKAFALVGQRIYVGGLSKERLAEAGVPWILAVQAVGAAAARSSFYAELMGTTEVPEGCDLLAGTCMMAGPVNQNDVGKSFFGYADLLAETYPDLDPTSLLVWTLKAKTVADPAGNEEQLLNAKRKGALVDLRPGPHEVVRVRRGGRFEALRKRDGRVNSERAFGDQGNFATDAEGRHIPGNRGSAWPEAWSSEVVW